MIREPADEQDLGSIIMPCKPCKSLQQRGAVGAVTEEEEDEVEEVGMNERDSKAVPC